MAEVPDDKDIQAIVERHFRIYESRSESFDGGLAARLFFVMFPPEEFDRRYEAVRRDIQELDDELLVFLRRDGGEDILFVTPRPMGGPIRNRTNVVLLILTLLTTIATGALWWGNYTSPGEDWAWSVFWLPENLLWGTITFALPLMLILGIHEMAHFIAARRHGLRATLPYFIPLPPILFFPIGTMGAFIRLKDPLPDRKALFDVGASGPLAGFVVAVPLLFLGAFLTADVGAEVPDLDRPTLIADDFVIDAAETGLTILTLSEVREGAYAFEVVAPDDEWALSLHAIVEADGETLEDTSTFTLDAGERHLGTIAVPQNASLAQVRVEWDDHLVQFGDPLIVQGLNQVIKPGDHLTHPTFFAAWVGILVTGINLLPAGQLDGGHIARAVLGERVRYAGLASVALLMFLAFQFNAWLLMALFLILTGVYHPPPLNDRTPLDGKRKFVAGIVVVVLALTFVPVPIHF